MSQSPWKKNKFDCPAEGQAQVLFPQHLKIPFREIRKRDGRLVVFNADKITAAIYKAARAVGGSNREIAARLTRAVIRELLEHGYSGVVPAVEEVQDAVERVLIENGHARTAKAYILYRDRRTRIREGKSELMDAVKEILIETNREDSAAGGSPAAKMLQIAMAASKKYYLSNLIHHEFARAHTAGDFHIHALEYYGKTMNCLQIDLCKLLERGCGAAVSGCLRPPRRISAAAAQTAILLQSSQNDLFGGQSFPHFDRDLATVIRSFPGPSTKEEIFSAMEGLVDHLNSTHSRAGARLPLTSINLGTDLSAEGRAVSAALLAVFRMDPGRGESTLLPRLIFRVKAGVNLERSDPNYDLFQLALRVAARRMTPTFSFMDTSFNRPYGEEVSYMGCLTRVSGNRHGPDVSAGRGNIAVVTLNLPRLALESRGRVDLFLARLDRLLGLGVRQLLHRFEILSRLRVKDLPFLMGEKLYLGSESLSPDDCAGAALKNGTLAVGLIGLAETLHALTGKHHGEGDAALELGLQIVQHLRRRIDHFSAEYDLNFVLAAPPAGSPAGRFVALDREKYGRIPGVTDRKFYTHSFHLPAGFALSPFDRLTIEGRFHTYCNGGHISYAALEASLQHNPEAVETIVRHMAASDIGFGGIHFSA